MKIPPFAVRVTTSSGLSYTHRARTVRNAKERAAELSRASDVIEADVTGHDGIAVAVFINGAEVLW